MDTDLFRLFADLLDYPNDNLLRKLTELETLLATTNPGLEDELVKFRNLITTQGQDGLELAYTEVFDMNPSNPLYIGHRLFGETYGRSAFMLGMKELYTEHDFVSESVEMPDHMVIVLRFLSICTESDRVAEVVSEAILPALGIAAREDDDDEEEEMSDIRRAMTERREAYLQVLVVLEKVLIGAYPPLPSTHEEGGGFYA